MKHTTKLLSIIAVTCLLLGLMGCQPTTGNIGCSHENTKITKNATCTETGLKECLDCGFEAKIPALGHNFEETSSVKPTCTTKGEKLYTCENCDETKTEEIPALGHTWGVVDDDSKWECETCKKLLTCDGDDFLVYVFESETSNKSDFIDIIVIKGKKDCVTYNTLKNDIPNKDIKFISTSFRNKEGERLWVPYTEVETECENETISSPVWIILE